MITRTFSLAEARGALKTLVEGADQMIYSDPAFLDFLVHVTRAELKIILAENNDSSVGALPYLVIERPGVGRMINSLAWWGSHGGCVVDSRRTDADETRKVLLAQYKAELEKPGLVSATMILTHSEEASRQVYVDALSPTVTDERIGQITQIPEDAQRNPEAMLEIFTQKTRNLVRKSLNQGFVEQVTDDEAAWDFLHRIHAENIAALGGRPKPREHFRALREILPANMRRLSLAMDGNTPVAALLLLYGGRTVEYVTPAIEVSARSRQPLSFLIWRGMLEAITRGFTAWNWGGTWSGQHSLHHFKGGFGAVDRPYTYLINSPPSGLAELRRRRAELDALFPYFYAYPFSLLDAPGGAM